MVFHSSSIAMMHGPMNIRSVTPCSDPGGYLSETCHASFVSSAHQQGGRHDTAQRGGCVSSPKRIRDLPPKTQQLQPATAVTIAVLVGSSTLSTDAKERKEAMSRLLRRAASVTSFRLIFDIYIEYNAWKVLKCGAGEGWRRSVGPIM